MALPPSFWLRMIRQSQTTQLRQVCELAADVKFSFEYRGYYLSQIALVETIFNKMKSIVLLFALTATSAHAVLLQVDSTNTYLRANGENPFPAIPYHLATYGFVPGQTVLLTRVGSFNNLGGGIPTDWGMSAVFTSSNVLLPAPLLNRLPGAVGTVAPSWASAATQIGGLTTDISEDFMVADNTNTLNGIVLTIPAGAHYIWGTAHDNFFSDNNNTNEFYLQIQPVPEPASLLALGFGAMWVRRRRR